MDHAWKVDGVCWRWRCSRQKDVSAEPKEECWREERRSGNQCCWRGESPCLEDGGVSSRFRDGCPRIER